MSALLKGATSVLIAMALIAIIGTGVILYYNTKDNSEDTASVTEQEESLFPGEESQSSSIAPEDSTSPPEDSGNPQDSSEQNAVESSASPIQVSSAGGSGTHNHEYVPTVAKDATCTVMGKMLYTCSCGSYYIEPIPTIPHTPGEWKVTKQVTTKADGTREKRCTVCGTLLNEETVSKKTLSSNTVSKNTTPVSENHYKHTHTYKSKVTEAETCTEEGLATFTCDCGATYTEPIPPTNHPSRQTIVTDATCSETGSVITSCAICKAVISHDILNKVSHKWGSWKVTTAPTKDAEGVRTRTCKVGGEEETQTIPKLGAPGSDHTHAYNNSSITTAATCTAAGVRTYTCSCGDSYTEELPALGHNPGNWQTVTEATATAKGVRKKFCRRCNAEVASEEIEFVSTHTHDYSSSYIATPATCGQDGTRIYTCACGATSSSVIKATGQHTTSGSSKVCSVCGQTVN